MCCLHLCPPDRIFTHICRTRGLALYANSTVDCVVLYCIVLYCTDWLTKINKWNMTFTCCIVNVMFLCRDLGNDAIVSWQDFLAHSVMYAWYLSVHPMTDLFKAWLIVVGFLIHHRLYWDQNRRQWLRRTPGRSRPGAEISKQSSWPLKETWSAKMSTKSGDIHIMD